MIFYESSSNNSSKTLVVDYNNPTEFLLFSNLIPTNNNRLLFVPITSFEISKLIIIVLSINYFNLIPITILEFYTKKINPHSD